MPSLLATSSVREEGGFRTGVGGLRTAMVLPWCYYLSMAVKKLSVALDEAVAEGAAVAAARHGVSLSAWLSAAAQRALLVEDGLAAVADWERDHGSLSPQDLAWADSILDDVADRLAS